MLSLRTSVHSEIATMYPFRKLGFFEDWQLFLEEETHTRKAT